MSFYDVSKKVPFFGPFSKCIMCLYCLLSSPSAAALFIYFIHDPVHPALSQQTRIPINLTKNLKNIKKAKNQEENK